ncbi:MAG: hypothetical protein JNK05_28705 [Myxococcales bacterium]|nr:hypothetical protein [Myxococcales bacterium]
MQAPVGLLPLKCVNCGGSLETTPTADILRCQYCKQLMLLHRQAAPTIAPVPSALVARQEVSANCLRPGDALNWQGGTLYVAPEGLAFVPHSFNFGTLERAVVFYPQIMGVTLDTGLISDDVVVTLRDGQTWSYRVRKGKELVEAIQQAAQPRA